MRTRKKQNELKNEVQDKKGNWIAQIDRRNYLLLSESDKPLPLELGFSCPNVSKT